MSLQSQQLAVFSSAEAVEKNGKPILHCAKHGNLECGLRLAYQKALDLCMTISLNFI